MMITFRTGYLSNVSGPRRFGGRALRTTAVAITIAMIAGCASPGGGVRLSDVRTDSHYHGERLIPGNFAQMQMALFKHEAACGHAARFIMDERETNYGSLIEMPEPSQTYENAIVVDVVQYRASYVGGPRMKAKVYSYRSDAQTLTRIERLFASIMHPGACDGRPAEAAPAPDSGTAPR